MLALIPQEIVDMAKNADLLSYLHRKGYSLIADSKSQNGKAFRLAEHDSLVISNNLWYWYSQGYGGNTLDFLVKYEGKGFRDAVIELTNYQQYEKTEEELQKEVNYARMQEKTHKHNEIKSDEIREFKLPEKSDNSKRVFAYLSISRCIDPDTISYLMHKKLIYESKDNHNCVFVGLDREGVPRYANLRGTLTDKSFKKECAGSSKKFSFSIPGTNKILRVFEGAIDAISDITLSKYLQPDANPYDTHRLSLGGVETLALVQYLSDHPDIEKIILRLDNDPTGRAAAEKIKAELDEKGYLVEIKHPKEKDVNADLISFSSKHDLSNYKASSSVYNKIDQLKKFKEASEKLKATTNNQERKGDTNVKCNR